MSKNRQPTEKELAESNVPLSHEHYRGMNDTMMPMGGDALRLALAEQLQEINIILKGDAPNLYAIEAKGGLEEIGKEIDLLESITDPETREETYQEIVALLTHTQQYVDRSKELLADETVQASMARVRPLSDPDKATLIIPGEDDVHGKTLH
ncbi:MAG: hypothetical protein Q7S52_00145 [bacterium]|nr:hypothetical protein [bacterium]